MADITVLCPACGELYVEAGCEPFELRPGDIPTSCPKCETRGWYTIRFYPLEAEASNA